MHVFIGAWAEAMSKAKCGLIYKLFIANCLQLELIFGLDCGIKDLFKCMTTFLCW